MSLHVVATPLGHPEDITLRAIKCLKNSDVIIGEEPKVTRRFLKSIEVPLDKILLSLNEHSSQKDLLELLELCKKQNVALISDCGTPGFCDPGADLIRLCRQHNIPITSLPGPSSLMLLLSMSSRPLKSFYFAGFLPRKTSERQKTLQKLSTLKEPIVLMDTPYRLHKLLDELSVFKNRSFLIGLQMTQPDETYIEG
ncbi:MAG: methyltransferase, partial [Bdellovibrio sp.]